MKYLLLGLVAVTFTGCTVTSQTGGDYASFSLLTETTVRGDICSSFSLAEEHRLLAELSDTSIDEIMIEEKLVKKYGQNVVLDCYVKIVDFHNDQLNKIVESIDEQTAE